MMQKERLIGLSTTYYATKGYSIYGSVLKTVDLGFDVVEFGAAHAYEHNIHNTLLKIKKDFPHVNFTVHTLFPPLKKRTWFNPANGLSEINKEIINGLFITASIMEALLISIHAPVFYDVSIGDKLISNFYKPVPGKPINETAGKKNFLKLMEYISNKIEVTGINVIIENMCANFQNTYPITESDYLDFFKKFPRFGMLLDTGHALSRNNMDNLMKLNGNILQVHLHDIGCNPNGKIGGHFPVRKKTFFNPLKGVAKNKTIVFVFEHGADTLEKDILKEKKMLEEFLAKDCSKILSEPL